MLMGQPWQRSSVTKWSVNCNEKSNKKNHVGNGCTYPLVDEHGKDENGNEEDNDEDDNDTRLALSPVLALHQLVNSILAASDEGHVDSGHCVM